MNNLTYIIRKIKKEQRKKYGVRTLDLAIKHQH